VRHRSIIERFVQNAGMPRRHLLFALSGEVAERVQGLRLEWDPVMADRIPPHVTLVYPQEVNDETLMVERIAEVASRTAAFDVSPGTVEKSNVDGVWYRVVDPSNTWSALRAVVLRPPFTPYPVIPHITVVHPRTSQRGPEALATLAGRVIDGQSRLDEVLYTETGKTGTRVLDRFSLDGPTG